MGIIRSSGYGLKDAEDDESFQMVIGDVKRLRQESAALSARVSALEQRVNPSFWGFSAWADTQAISGGQNVVWNTGTYDVFFDTTSGAFTSAGVTVPETGHYRYCFYGNINQQNNPATNLESCSVLVLRNGGGLIVGSFPQISLTTSTISTVVYPISLSGILSLTAGDLIQMFWSATASLSCTGNAIWSFERINKY